MDTPTNETKPDSVEIKFLEYIQRYQEAMNHGLANSQNSPYHSATTGVVCVLKASDAYGVFYLPAPDDEEIKEGIYFFDLSQYDINTVCQSVSVHRFKITYPEIGAEVSPLKPIPPDTEPIPDFSVPWIEDSIRQAGIQRKITSLPGITLSPIVYFENNRWHHLVTARQVVWSPVVKIGALERTRLFLWTHAELWWNLPELIETLPVPEEAAKADLAALAVVSADLNAGAPVSNDSGSTAANKLREMCSEFKALLGEPTTTEETVHQWLYEQSHQVFLDPYAVRVLSKIPFGKYTSDFVIERPAHDYLLIEIERPGMPIFTKSKQVPTADFNNAVQQVRDWRRYIRDNTSTVQSELGLEGIYEPPGLVIAGRSRGITGPQLENRWKDLKSSLDNIHPLTYDELIERVLALADTIENATRPSSS